MVDGDMPQIQIIARNRGLLIWDEINKNEYKQSILSSQAGMLIQRISPDRDFKSAFQKVFGSHPLEIPGNNFYY